MLTYHYHSCRTHIFDTIENVKGILVKVKNLSWLPIINLSHSLPTKCLIKTKWTSLSASKIYFHLAFSQSTILLLKTKKKKLIDLSYRILFPILNPTLNCHLHLRFFLPHGYNFVLQYNDLTLNSFSNNTFQTLPN